MSSRIDLSQLPPEIRRKVEAGLATLSPEARRKWEEKGSPLLARLLAGLAGQPVASSEPPPAPGPASPFQRPAEQAGRTAGANVSPARVAAPSVGVIRRTPPHGHYNDTIAPGDRPGLVQRLLLGLVVVGFGLWLVLY